MAKGLAAAVMGEIALQSRRGQVAGVFPEGGTRPGAARQAQLWRAGQGGHAAVLKKIAQGATHTPGQLGKQLDYLFSKAAWCGGNALDYDPDRQSFAPKERKALVRTWSADWTRSPKNGHTTHLLMSFPGHVAADRARWIAGEWAEAMFQSPDDKGDAWHYVMALHTDRAHPHVHLVIQNRGLDRGRWFYMAKDHVFELQAMKERMAEIAASRGIKLESTTRIGRGILSYSVDRSEIERARREDRPIRERVRSGAALRSALEEMRAVSKVYADLAFLARGMEARDVAARMQAASRALADGRPIDFKGEEVTMTTVETVTARADFQAHVQTWLDRTSSPPEPSSVAVRIPDLAEIVASDLSGARYPTGIMAKRLDR